MSLITDTINSLIDSRLKMQTVLCQVNSVDTANKTCNCSPVNGGADFLNVRLQATTKDNNLGVTVFPKVDSLVVVGLIEDNSSAACVLVTTEVTDMMIKTEGFEWYLSGSQLLFNEGLNGGLVIIQNLVDRLNVIEKAHNKLLIDYNSHIHAGNGVISSKISTAKVGLTQVAQLENDKIKH